MSARHLGWGLLVLGCGVFALLALEYPLGLFVEGAPQLWFSLLEWTAGSEYALGPGSLFESQWAHYQAFRWVMAVHVVAGALTLLLAPLQFSDRLEDHHPRIYRYLVVAVFSTGGVAMVGALVFLLGSDAGSAFAGPIFVAESWGVLVLYLGASGMALFSSRWDRPAAHRGWAAMAFGLLLAAPMLRIGWLFCGWLWPHIPQAVMTPAIAIAVAPIGVLGAGIYVSRGDHHGPAVDALPLWTLPAAALLFVSCVLYVPELTQGDLIARATVAVVIIATALIAATSTAESALARGRGDYLRAREWHGYALTALLGCVPGAVVTAWLVAFGVHVPTATAVGAALSVVVGPIVGFVAALRLRNLAGPRRPLPDLPPSTERPPTNRPVVRELSLTDMNEHVTGVDVHEFMSRH